MERCMCVTTSIISDEELGYYIWYHISIKICANKYARPYRLWCLVRLGSIEKQNQDRRN